MKKWLLLVSLLLLACLCRAKWMWDHPSPTSFDVAQRSLLRRASSVHLLVTDHSIPIDTNLWFRFLDGLYLKPTAPLRVPNLTDWVKLDAKFTDQYTRNVGDRFVLYDPCSHRATMNTFDADGDWQTFELHPLSVRALEQLIKENCKQWDLIKMLSPFQGCH